tara:strand:+ start:386 stop:514 length:129 start_codon:yes stop_codon:yes gene_type:complete
MLDRGLFDFLLINGFRSVSIQDLRTSRNGDLYRCGFDYMVRL